MNIRKLRSSFTWNRYDIRYLDIGYHRPVTNYCQVTIAKEPLPGLSKAFNIDENLLENRFRHGDICFIAHENGQYLGASWGHQGACFVRGAGKLLDLRDDEVYKYGSYTVPMARGRGVYRSINDVFFAYYEKERIKRFWEMNSPSNTMISGTLCRIGWIKYSALWHVKMGPVDILLERFYLDGRNKLTIVSGAAPACYVI